MNPRRISRIWFTAASSALLLSLSGSLLRAADAAPPGEAPPAAPTAVSTAAEEARKLVEMGKYREALTLISKELSSASRATEDSNDRHLLLGLRGESYLRLGESRMAGDSFDKASQAAANLRPPDVKYAAAALANALLARASPKHIYKPASGQPIDIADPEARKAGFAALRESMSKTVTPKIEAAKRSTTLPPLFDLLPALTDLGSLEFAANGAALETKATLVELGDTAHKLMTSELKHVGNRINQLGDTADSISGTTGNGGYVGRRGLNTNERKELESAVVYLRKIEEAAAQAHADARLLGFSGERWEPVITEAAELANRAQSIRNLDPP